MNRKDFIKSSAFAAATLAIHPLQFASGRAQQQKVRAALIGVGLRGQSHLDLLLRRDDTEVVAICDIDPRMLEMSKALFRKYKKKEAQVFTGDPYAWKNLLALKGIDTVIISTPWEWHKEMIISSLEANVKWVATEVMIGITLADHWEVVNAAERSNGHVMMLENVCYRRDVMAVLNMVRQGVFGELIHLQGGYQHDLREVKFNDGKSAYGNGCEFGEKGWSEARWRTLHSVHHNGDLYPTHGIGPIANYININRGNRFVHLSSFASKARGLHNHILKTCGAEHPNAKIEFKLGDVVTTNIACANGETVLLQHDTNLPRPYSLGFRVQGTEGLWMDVNQSVYVEGKSQPHQWDPQKEWLEKYDHPLWKKFSRDAEGAGHGGMDFFVINALVESIKQQVPPPMDVYDAAAWSAITPLSERSIELGSQTVEFPDFTGGKWMYRKPAFALDDSY